MQTENKNVKKGYSFLRGGGEMGQRTRDLDWSKTPVGSPDSWPQSLRTIVSVLLNSRFPMFLWWGEELIQFYNDAYRPSLGNEGKHPTALGQRAIECWPEIWEIIYPLIRQVLTTGEATWSEDQLVPIYRNGRIEDVYWTFGYSPVMGDSGKIEGVLVVCTETTEKVNNLKEQILTLKKIEESEERFRTMAEASDILIAMSDETSNAIYFNKAWVDLTGRPMEALLEYGWADLVHPADRDRYLNIYLSAFAKKESFTGEFRVLNKEGHYSWLLAQGPPRFRPDGSFAGYISSCMDITDRKRTEEALKDSEQQVRSLVDSAPFPIGLYTGREMRIAFANHAMLEVWGKGHNVIGKLYTDILSELEGQAIFAQLEEVFLTGVPFHARNRQVDIEINGELRLYYFNYSFTPLYDAGGKVYGVMNTAAEVTDQVLARQKIEEIVAARTKELAEANEKLQKSNAELAQFAYIASHDLQEPIRKVSTFAQMLETSLGPINEQSRNYLDRINNASTRMLTLIRDVLTYSELSKEIEVFEPVDLQQVLEGLHTDFELLIEQKGAHIRYTDLPVIKAIPLQMSQLFRNLLSNALKFARQDRPPEITITATLLSGEEAIRRALPDPAVSYYHIEVRDNGIGFKQAYAEQIFSIFQRLHIKSEYPGTGIGLAMCKKIVQNHQGEIYANGDQEKGSTFTIILPARLG